MYSDCHLLRTQYLWKRLFWNKRESNHCIKNNFKMMSFYTRDVHTSLIYQPTSGRIFPSHGFWSDSLFTKMSGADRTPWTWEDESAHVQWKHLVNIRHALVVFPSCSNEIPVFNVSSTMGQRLWSESNISFQTIKSIVCNCYFKFTLGLAIFQT